MSSFYLLTVLSISFFVLYPAVEADLDHLFHEAAHLLFGGGALTGSLDKYMDQLVNGINTHISYPLILPDYNVSINTEVLIIPILGSLKLYGSKVTQIGAVSRSGEAAVKYDNQILNIDLALKVNNVKFSGNFEAELESLGPSGSLSGEIGELVVKAALEADTSRLQVTVTKFELDAGSVDVSVSVLPLMDWLINAIINLLVYIIQWPLMTIISSDVQKSLQALIKSYTDLVQ